MIAIAFAIIAPIVARFVQLAISRQREYLADASGVELTRNPVGLEQALAKIALDTEPLEVANRATQHLYFENPIKGVSGKRSDLFSTHPAGDRPDQSAARAPGAGPDRQPADRARARVRGRRRLAAPARAARGTARRPARPAGTARSVRPAGVAIGPGFERPAFSPPAARPGTAGSNAPRSARRLRAPEPPVRTPRVQPAGCAPRNRRFERPAFSPPAARPGTAGSNAPRSARRLRAPEPPVRTPRVQPAGSTAALNGRRAAGSRRGRPVGAVLGTELMTPSASVPRLVARSGRMVFSAPPMGPLGDPGQGRDSSVGRARD